MAYQEISAINAQERVQITHQAMAGDFQEAQDIIQHDEAIKAELRSEATLYDAPPENRGRVNYSYYDYPEW